MIAASRRPAEDADDALGIAAVAAAADIHYSFGLQVGLRLLAFVPSTLFFNKWGLLDVVFSEMIACAGGRRSADRIRAQGAHCCRHPQPVCRRKQACYAVAKIIPESETCSTFLACAQIAHPLHVIRSERRCGTAGARRSIQT